MIDSDIKRSFKITSERTVECLMVIPLDAIITSDDAWKAFGDFAKIEGSAEEVLERMANFIKKAKL